MNRCACRTGRDLDGAEFGPCEYCEAVSDQEAEQRALERDAARWRFTQKPKFYLNLSEDVDEIESNVVAVYLGQTWVGVGHDAPSAVDCARMLTELHSDDVPVEEVLKVYRLHYRRKWNGQSRQMPQRPDFAALADQVSE